MERHELDWEKQREQPGHSREDRHDDAHDHGDDAHELRKGAGGQRSGEHGADDNVKGSNLYLWNENSTIDGNLSH